MKAGQIKFFRPENGKQREAFADGSWKNPYALGPLGKIRWDKMDPQSIAAHAGVSRDGKGGYAITPAAIGTTIPAATCDELARRFANAVVEARKGNVYGRLGNKTSFELEMALAGIHGCGDGMVFGSGMAAISHLILTLVTAGDNVVFHKTMYGCTDDLATKILPALGIEVRLADLRAPRVLRHAIDGRTRLVFFETPANPTLDLINIAEVVHEVNGRCPIAVDNTFASPVTQNPFEHGANMIVYSLSKSVGGHTSALGGGVFASGLFIAHLFATRKDIGGVLSGREAEAFLQGLKTLFIRYDRMQENAIKVATMIAAQSTVSRTFYPLLDPYYPLGNQMTGPGHMVSFVLNGGINAGKTLIDNLSKITHAVSLGGVETLICHPASTTHASIDAKQRKTKGIEDGLIRLSVGIENIDDIIGDLMQAFATVGKMR